MMYSYLMIYDSWLNSSLYAFLSSLVTYFTIYILKYTYVGTVIDLTMQNFNVLQQFKLLM